MVLHVEKFYLFFDPYFSLFKKKVGETEYGIGWLPLGGYVKISGMIDESMDKEQMKKPPQPWEFRSKPAWQRLIIMVGGVTVNVILAFFIYSMMLFAWGKSYIPNDNLTYGVYADSLMVANGFMQGDQILTVEGEAPETVGDVNAAILFGDARQIAVNRNGERTLVTLPEDIDQDMLKLGRQIVFTERFPAEVDSVSPGLAADKAGLMKGDKILSVNDEETLFFQDVVTALGAKKGQEVSITISRNNEVSTVSATVDEDGRIGFVNRSMLDYLEPVVLEYTFLESFPAGVNEGWSRLTDYVRSLKLLFSGEGVKQVGGFITIGKLFDNTWNWQRFWNMTAFLSIILAVMNILPIPALDGGHVMFLLYEMISGRKPNDKFMEYAQMIGFFLLIALVLFANGNDIYRWLFDK